MQYEDILKKIQQEENNNQRIDLYRYNGLLEAIRFFSNRLSLEQITDTAFDFANELLTVDRSVMYLWKNNQYVLTKKRGVDKADNFIEKTPELSSFALYVGNVLNGINSLRTFFSELLLNETKATVMIPLILGNDLYGFLLLSGRISAPFDDKDITMCETLMSLINSAMENSSYLERLQSSNRELDEKIFNLFAINQSAKAMLTEHNLNELYSLAVDVFSELTLSAHTAFVLYDAPSGKYLLKAYRDVFSRNSIHNFCLTLNRDAKHSKQHDILNLSLSYDKDYLSGLFSEGIEAFEELKAKYVVLIYDKKNILLGFVTLGETVSGEPYKKSAFELVDSLASYTYIALSNAMLIQVVNDQKHLLQKKLDRLNTLNMLAKNINSALDSRSIIELAIKTMDVSFGVESSIIALYDAKQDALKVAASTDITLNGLTLKFNESLNPLKNGRIVFESNSNNLPNLIGSEISALIRNNAGVLAIPMTIDRYEPIFIGAILIFKIREGLISDEENVLTFQTISNQMTPLINGFMNLEQQQGLLKQDHAKAFTLKLQSQIEECVEYDLDFEIVSILDHQASPFTDGSIVEILACIVKDLYPVSYERTEIILSQNFEYSYILITSALADKNVTIKRFRYKKDFNDLSEYLAI